LVTYRVGTSARRRSPIPVLTGLNVEQLRSCDERHYRYAKPDMCALIAVLLLTVYTGEQMMLYRRDVTEVETAAACTTCHMRQTADTASGLQPTLTASNMRSSTSAAVTAAAADTVCSVHSCPHITLGYTSSSEPAQAGDDLLRVRRLAVRSSNVVDSVTVHDALIDYYGDGLCSVRFDRPMHLAALFSPIY